MEKETAKIMARPKKIKPPVNLETVLRIVLPRKRPEDRMKIFREFAKVNLWARLGRQPSEEEFHREFEEWCKKQFYSGIDWLSDSLKEFVPKYSAENRKKRAQIAAAKRWSEKS